jgi:hypothetical protein
MDNLGSITITDNAIPQVNMHFRIPLSAPSTSRYGYAFPALPEFTQ